ncbi:NAD(P)-binding domain-containing protein [Xanthobacter sp. 126]|nr:NAD(P)-binding domain-containing protein [Xanthobacter sp. 126]
MTIETIGVIGLGNMGFGMAATLAGKGFRVSATTPQNELSAG